MSPAADTHRSTPRRSTGSRRQRKVLLAAGLGTAIEYFDFSIYAFMATSIAQVFFPQEDRTAALLSTFAVFGVSFLLRPLGGVLMGHLADRYGRRTALTVAVVGMAGASFAIGVIPSYASIGIVATLLLVLMRSIQGLSAGGELGTAASYLAEESPTRRRGFHTCFVNLGTILGTVFGSLTVAVLKASMSGEQIVAWGWRIPFLVSLPLGIVALIVRSRMNESAQFEAIREEQGIKRAPLSSLFRTHRRGLLCVTLLALTANAGYWVVFAYLGSYFETREIMPAGLSAWVTTIALALSALTLPLWAVLSDRVGRRTVLFAVNATILIVAFPAFVLINQSPTLAIVTQLVLGQVVTAYLATILAAFAEMFPAGVRVSGFAFGYNIAAVVGGGTAPYAATWLISTTGNPSSPAFFLMAATALALVGALLMRETAGKPLPLN